MTRPDPLARAVDALDRRRTDARLLDRLPRRPAKLVICLACRRSPAPVRVPPGHVLLPAERCACGGVLVEVA